MSLPRLESITEAPHPAPGLLGSFGINGSLFLAQWVNFAIVFFVLWRFAYRPLMQILRERSTRIDAGLKHAAEMDTRIAALEAERGEVLATARREASELLTKAQADQKAQAERVLADAKEQGARTVEKGKAQLAQDRAAALQEWKGELASLVVAAAQKVAGGALQSKEAEQKAATEIERLLV